MLTPIVSSLNDNVKQKQPEHALSKSMHQKQLNIANEQISSMVKNLIHYLDLTLFQDGVFISMFVYFFGNGYILTGWLIYLVPFAVDVGLPSYKAVSLSSYGGFGTLLGSVLYPLLSERFSSNQILFFFTLNVFLSLVVYPLISAFDSYIGLVFASIVFGCAEGVVVVCVYQIIKEGVHVDQAKNAVMWINFSHSIGSVLSGFVSGL